MWRRGWADRCGGAGTGGARGVIFGDGPVRAAEKVLTGGPWRHRAWMVRRLAPGASARPPSGFPYGDAWCSGSAEEVEGCGGLLARAERLFSGDHKRAAPPGTAVPAVTTVLCMSEAASA